MVRLIPPIEIDKTKEKLFSESKFKIKLVFKYTYSDELALGISILDSFLSKHGYYVEQYNLNDNFDSFMNKLISSTYLSKKIFDTVKNKIFIEMGYRYLNSDNHPFARVLDKIINKMGLTSFELLGFSVHSKYQLIPYLALAKRIKERYNIPIVLGGPYIKLFHEYIDLEKYKFIDFLIISDAELALLELVRYLEGKQKDISKIPSLKYIHDNKIIRNKELLIDIEDIPIYNHNKQRLNKIQNSQFNISGGIPYIIAKGCPFRCTFCTYSSLNEYQRKSLDVVIKELKILKETHNCNKFRFTDATINANPKYLEDLCDILIENNLGIEWFAMATPNIKLELLIKMRRAGCLALMYGVETGSSKMNKSMRKTVSVERGEKCVQDTYSANIKNLLNFIIGFPHETIDDVKDTIGFIIRNSKFIHNVNISRFQLTPNVPIFNNPEQFDIKIIGQLSKLNIDTFKFDEINGLKWKQKIKQTKKHIRMVEKVVRKCKINYACESRLI